MTITVPQADGLVTRYRVLVGEDDDTNRRGAKRLVAFSDCAIYCRDSAAIDRIIEALRNSDEQLKARPESEKFYDWQSTYIQPDVESRAGGGHVLFGVSWYDEDYFGEKMSAFMNGRHVRMFGALGVAQEDVSVTHWRALATAS